jgi:uncharacterized protein YjiS (DUF1127 family)
MICSQSARTAAPISATAARILEPVGRAWRAYWDWRARRMTAHILRSLDARTLHDIGIGPGEIDSVVYGRPYDRKCRYHAHWRTSFGA